MIVGEQPGRISRPLWKISPGHSDDATSHYYQEMTRSQRAASWVADQYISVGFGDFSESLYGSSWEEIKKEFEDRGQSAHQAGYLNSFLHAMKPGDLVVFRTGPSSTAPGEVHIGRVGSYYCHPAGSEHQHRRRVTWLAAIARDKGDRDLERATFLRATIVTIKDKAQEDGVNFYDVIADRFGLDDQYIAPRVALGRIAEPVRADYLPNADGPRASPFEATVAATNSHNKTQNNLCGWLQRQFGKNAVQTFDPSLDWAAQVDLLLEEDERITIIEVKSLQDGNDVDQLRYGLAQTLDYMDRYRSDGRDVHGVLWLSSEPKDSARWRQLCDRYDVRVGWPGEERHVFER